MVSLLKTVVAPIISLIILIMGNGLMMTISPIQLKLFGYSTTAAGFLTSAFFAGLMIGSTYINRFIEGVGHIRSFAAFASLISIIAILQGLFVHPVLWIFMRFFTGICMGGLFITIESWLLVKSSIEMRGKVLSIYMSAFYAAQALGQLLLDLSDPKSITPFCIIVVFSSLSVVPLALSKARAPIMEEPSHLKIAKLFKISPLGVVGAMLSGLILGSVYGLLPIYSQELKFELAQIAKIMAITIFGGFVLQWPIGHISDKMDRRKVIFIVSCLTIVLSLMIAIMPTSKALLFYCLCWIFGGISFTIYPLCISHACDQVEVKDLVAATGGILLFYGAGCIIGPIIAPMFMKTLGPDGLFYFIALVASTLAVISFIRILEKKPIAKDDKLPYSNIPRTTPLVSELDPRSEEDTQDK